MHNAYEFIGKYGIMSEDDYPYTGLEETCKYDASKVQVESSAYRKLASNPVRIRDEGLT